MGDYKEKVGEPTGEISTVGRPIYKTPEGEMVSEQSTTFKYKGKWINIPTIHNGYSYDDDELRLMLDHNILKPTSTHKNIKSAEKAAEAHSNTLSNFAQGGLTMNNQTQMAFALGGEAETVDPVSGNDVPPGSLPAEVRDDLPARLSEGEYVVPADVVRFFGVKFFENLRAKAKIGLQQMDADGRIGGDPVPSMGEATLSDEDFEKILTAELSKSQPETERAFAHGGVHYGFGGGSGVGSRGFGSGSFGAPKSTQANTKVTLVSADGKSTKVYLSPRDDALINYWKGVGWTVGPASTETKPEAPSNNKNDMTTAEREALAAKGETESTPWYEEDPKFYDDPQQYIKDQLKIGNKFLASDKGKGLGLLFPAVGVAGLLNVGAQAQAASKARGAFFAHQALGTKGFNDGDDGYAELVKSLDAAGFESIAPGTMRADDWAKSFGFDDYADAISSSTTFSDKYKPDPSRKGYKELKTGRASGTSEFASDDSKIYGEGTIAGLSNNELLKRKFEQRRRYKKLEEEDKIISRIQTPAQQKAGESASNDRGDPGIDFSSARTGTTDFKNPDTDKGPGTVFKNVTTYDTEKVKAIAKANAEKGIYTPAKAKGGLITKPKKTKKKTKAYKKGGLASKK